VQPHRCISPWLHQWRLQNRREDGHWHGKPQPKGRRRWNVPRGCQWQRQRVQDAVQVQGVWNGVPHRARARWTHEEALEATTGRRWWWRRRREVA
jgi:hypothetical protein